VLLRQPLEGSRREVLEREVAFYRALDAIQRREFEQNVQCFLAEHTITGPKGADVADDVKVLVAASAAMLLFGREDLDLPRYVDVVIYPDRFDPESYDVSKRADVSGVVHWQGPVIFSERDLREAFAKARDGLHVGLHEFAHLLDLESGHFDGMPSGMPWTAAKPWMAIVHSEMRRIRAHRSVMREYGATNEPEFFAVATEAFFERPNEMRAKHPKLYEALRGFYGQDPAVRAGKTAE
jgi:Mlc titration factor MtfA (ptsG expression regulator)